MQVYNSLSRKKAEFNTIEENKVRMYSCGITTYSDSHIGHAKQALQFDVIRRYLEYKGYDVTYVRNWTDVDDKIINSANAHNMAPLDWARIYIDRTSADMAALGIRPADIEPKASETIPEIIEFVQALIDNGAREVYACASHGVLSGPACDRIEASPLKEVMLLNTIPMPEHYHGHKIRQLDVSPLFAKAITRIYNETPISSLF